MRKMARLTDYNQLLNRIMDAADDCDKLSGTDREKDAYVAGFTACEAIVRSAPTFTLELSISCSEEISYGKGGTRS